MFILLSLSLSHSWACAVCVRYCTTCTTQCTHHTETSNDNDSSTKQRQFDKSTDIYMRHICVCVTNFHQTNDVVVVRSAAQTQLQMYKCFASEIRNSFYILFIIGVVTPSFVWNCLSCLPACMCVCVALAPGNIRASVYMAHGNQNRGDGSTSRHNTHKPKNGYFRFIFICYYYSK